MDEPIYINATDTFTPFPDSIIKETAHKFLDSFLKERRKDKNMAKLQYIEYRAKRRWFLWYEGGWNKIDICADCLNKIISAKERSDSE